MERLIAVDSKILYFINTQWTHAWLDIFFPFITDLNKNPWFALVIIPFIGLFYWKYKWRGLVLFLGLVLCIGASDFFGHLIKDHFQRPRPFESAGFEVVVRSPAGGFGFPSNHAGNNFAMATYVAFFIPEVFWLVYAIAFAVAYSRMYNGVHFPFDVFAGAVFGCLWAFVFRRIFRMFLPEDQRPR